MDTEIAELAPQDARFHVLPVPYEKTVSYGHGTAHGPGAIIAAFCSQGPGFRMSPETLPAASLTKAIRV